MNNTARISNLTDAEIRAIQDATERRALGGLAGAIIRAGLGTMALILTIFAVMDPKTVGLIFLSAAFIFGLAAYIRTVARSASTIALRKARLPRPGLTPPSVESAPLTASGS